MRRWLTSVVFECVRSADAERIAEMGPWRSVLREMRNETAVGATRFCLRGYAAKAQPSVAVFGQDGEGEELDALVRERLGFLGRRLTVNATGRSFLVMDLARLLGEARADVLRLGFDLGPQLAHGSSQLLVGGDALRLGLGRLCSRLVSGHLGAALRLVALGDARRHQRLGDLGGTARRARDAALLGLAVERG